MEEIRSDQIQISDKRVEFLSDKMVGFALENYRVTRFDFFFSDLS